MQRKRLIYYGLVLLFVMDIVYSSYQHLHTPLDGDMAVIILPSKEYSQVMTDPLAISAAFKHENYVGTNRYFVHLFMHHYFRSVPGFFRSFLNPIDSVYAAVGLLKICSHLALILLLSSIVRISQITRKEDFPLILVLFAAMFQTRGFYAGMGVIDFAPTYVCFYVFPTIFLLIFLRPFLRAWITDTPLKLKLWEKILFPFFWIYLPLSGPLNSGIILIIGLLLSIYLVSKSWKERHLSNFFRQFTINLEPNYIYYLLPVGIMSLYSVYAGQFNLENFTNTLPLNLRYERAAKGLFKILTIKPGTILLLAWIANSYALLYKREPSSWSRERSILKYALSFAFIYVLLVPLAGYRDYRPLILRYDVFMPITLVIMYFTVRATMLVIPILQHDLKKYIGGLTILAAIFFLVDQPDTDHYQCQRAELERIASSNEPVVLLDGNCPVLSWDIPKDRLVSGYNAKMIEVWQITDTLRHWRHVGETTSDSN